MHRTCPLIYARRMRTLLAVCLFAACRREPAEATRRDSEPAPLSSTSAKTDASADVAVTLRGTPCRDGKLTAVLPPPASGPAPKDDTGPFMIDGIVEGVVDNHPPRSRCVAGASLVSSADQALCPLIPSVRTCVEAARKTEPNLVGTLELELEYTKSGSVSRADVGSGTLPEGAHACIVTALRASTLPGDGDALATRVRYRVVVGAAHGRSPIARIEPTKLEVNGAVTADALKERLRTSGLRECYERALRSDKALAGTISVGLTIRRIAKHEFGAARATTEPGTLKNGPLIDCVNQKLDGLTFPLAADAGVATANVTLELSHSRP